MGQCESQGVPKEIQNESSDYKHSSGKGELGFQALAWEGDFSFFFFFYFKIFTEHPYIAEQTNVLGIKGDGPISFIQSIVYRHEFNRIKGNMKQMPCWRCKQSAEEYRVLSDEF